MILRAYSLVVPTCGKSDADLLPDYIPQGHRFDILEDIGCYPSTYNTWVAYVLVISWPLVIGLISGVYCGECKVVLCYSLLISRTCSFIVKNLLLIRRISRSAGQLASETGDGSNSLNKYRFLRLAALASVDILITIPLSTWILFLDISLGVKPWISWEDTHYNFSRVALVPSLLWRQSPLADSSRWLVICTAFVFFAIFGTSKDVLRTNLDLVRGDFSYLRGVGKKRLRSTLPHRRLR